MAWCIPAWTWVSRFRRVLFGVFMDRGWYSATLLGAAAVLLLSVVAALGVG